MARFHLGWVDPAGGETDDVTRLTVQGKRIRPQLASLFCTAVCGTPEAAAPLAAAIELLHNFTLVHDDIQDRSPNRRHRATVWRIWGDAQAINAGDALFAIAQRALLRTDPKFAAPVTVLNLLDEFNRVTIEIVQGQVLDLEFESNSGVTPADYLTMIGGKTAAILRFAAWAGATVGSGRDDIAALLGNAGEALGMGFQVRDDVLGIWGSEGQTGKDQGDDIRRRKKSLPILLLAERASEEEASRLAELYAADEIDPAGVAEVLGMLDRHDIERLSTAHVRHYHQQAVAALDDAGPALDPASLAALQNLVHRLDTRSS